MSKFLHDDDNTKAVPVLRVFSENSLANNLDNLENECFSRKVDEYGSYSSK